MSKDGLNPIGKMEAKLKHLEFIQGVVNRLAARARRSTGRSLRDLAAGRMSLTPEALIPPG